MNWLRRSGKSGSTAITAPPWITTLKRSLWCGSQCSAMSRWPVEEMGRNSVIPSTIPSMTAVIQSGMRPLERKTPRLTSRKEASDPSLLLENRRQEGLRFLVLPLDLDLPEDRMPADVKPVPLTLEVAQRGVVHLAEIAQGRRAPHQVHHFLLGRRARLDGRQDQLQLLDHDGLHFEEMVLLLVVELLQARDVHEMIELFPALRVGLQLLDQLVHFGGVHRGVTVGVGVWQLGIARGKGLRSQKNNRAAAQFARGQLQA